MSVSAEDGPGGFAAHRAPAGDGGGLVIDLRSTLMPVWHARRRIAAFAAVLAVVVAALSLLIPAKYAATASLLVDPRGLNVLQNDLTTQSPSRETAAAEAQSQVSVILSNDVLLEVVRRADLAGDIEFGSPPPGLRDFVRDWVGSDHEKDKQLIARKALGKVIDVSRNDMTYVVDVTVTTKDAEKSAMLANLVADVYLDRRRDARANLVRRSSGALESRLNELRAAVQDSEREVEEYRRSRDLASANGNLIVDQQLSDLTGELSRAEATVAELEARYQDIQRLRERRISPEMLAESLNSPTISGFRSQLASAEAELSALQRMFGAKHPRIHQAQATVDQMKGQIRQELDRISEGLEVERDRALSQRDRLEQRIEQMKTSSFEEKQANLGLQELTRQAAADRSVYEAFLLRYGELAEQEGVDTSSVQLISAALPPLDKSWPPRTLLVLASGVFGLLLGVGHTLFREHLQPTVTGARQVERETGQRVRATISRRDLEDPARKPFSSVRALEPLWNHLLRDAGGSPWILLAAASDGERSAAVTLALAGCAAGGGERVLLVDADDRAGQLSAEFGAAEDPGLHDLVREPAALAAMQSISSEPSVRLMPHGQTRSRHALPEALQLRRIVEDASGAKGAVLVDAGTIWTSRLHGPAVTAADAVLLVAETGRTRLYELSDAARTLASADAEGLGVILVDV